jgi:hypothetical protein
MTMDRMQEHFNPVAVRIMKRAKRAIIASQRARPFGKLRAGSFARLAQIPHCAKNACSE